ncbi:tape measure protein [Rhodococcus globerulus]|uniref:tape measure protein n=1 Tax=Rhodococcus globerulus TaxID=33008 RepID=UPI001C56FB48|nr:tape measure protein [Rhodococcus globerulus]QXW04005.1 tape measure protein [Rhodococcus globerulus]
MTAAGIELATMYVSIAARTDGIPAAVAKVVPQIEKQGDKAGQGLGSRMASGIGSAFKVGGAAIGAAAALTIGTALNKGMERVIQIDDAKGKLAGLGHSTEAVANIMDSAMASVKGTAFGMGDAAGIAASAVAAGIKPGQELTKYLSLTGDAATIAGSSLGEMGSIFNKVQTSGKAYTDTLNQLSDRGIPIFQWLQEEYGVSSEALSKMVKSGKVDAETFNKVIQKNIGGAALESGKTLRGSFANMKAALGRAGAAVIEPFVPMMKAGLGQITAFTDKVTPGLKAGAAKVAGSLTEMGAAFMSSGKSIDGPASNMEKFGVKAREVADGVKGVWSILAKGDFTGNPFGLSEDSKAVDVLFKIRETAIGVTDILFKGDYTNPIWGGLEDSKAVDVLFRIREGAQQLWEVIKSPDGEKFTAFLDTVKGTGGEAAGAMGAVESGANTLTGALKSIGSAAAGGLTALVGLGGDTATVAVAGIKALGSVMGFFADHTGLATVALGGFAASVAIAKTVETGFHAARIANAIMMPAQIAAQMALTRALVAHTAALWANTGAQAPNTALTLRARVAELASAAATNLRSAATVTSTSTLGAYAAAQRVAATQNGLFVGGMRNAAAGVATFAGGVQGAAGAALAGMRNGVSRVATMLGPGGLFAVGLLAAVAVIGTFASASGNLSRNLDANRDSAQKYAKSLIDFRSQLNDAFTESNGTVDSGVKSIVSGQIQAMETELDDAAKRLPSKMQYVTAFFKESFSFGEGNQIGDAMGLEDASEQAAKAQAAIESLNLSQKDMSKAVTGTEDQWRRFSTALRNTGPDGAIAVEKFGDMRREFQESQSSAGQFKSALDAINTGAVGAASGVDGLTGAMGRWRGDLMTAEESQAKVTLALSQFAQAASTAGASAFTASGELNLTTAAGAGLHSEMQAVAGAFDSAGAAAMQHATDQKLSANDAKAAVEAAGQKVRDEFIRQRIEAGYTLEQATALANQYKLFPEKLPTQISLTGAAEAQAAIDQFLAANRGRSIAVDIIQNIVQPPSGPAMPTTLGGMYGYVDGGRLPRNSTGSRLPTSGPGTDRVDGILGVGRDGVPTSWVDKGEWIINGRSSEKWDWLLGMINRDDARLDKLPRFAAGGRNGIEAALSAGRGVEGNQYVWGGTGPTGFDCSGFVGWLQQIVMGIVGSTKRLYTTYDLVGKNAFASLVSGLGPAGTQFQVGVSQEHMAATIAGQPAESGGAHGTSGIGGGRATAQDSQFPYKFHLPNELIDGWDGVAGTFAAGETPVVWTEKDQLALESARVAVTQAQEARDKVNTNDKKSQADKDQADLKVQRAELKVRELEAKRDGKGAAAAISNDPAPILTGEMGEDAISVRNAEIALLDAQLARDKTYNDPESTSIDKEKADISVYSAQNSLAQVRKKSDESASGDFSLKDRLKNYGSELVGIAVDSALEIFGVNSRWLDIAIPSFKKPAEGSTVSPQSAMDVIKNPLANFTSPSPTQAQLAGQLPVTPGVGNWVEDWLKTLPIKLYDQGGMIPHGGLALNKSGAPEPVFTAPEFANIARIANLDMLAINPNAGGGNDYSVNINNPTFSDGMAAVRSAQKAQGRQIMRHAGRPGS